MKYKLMVKDCFCDSQLTTHHHYNCLEIRIGFLEWAASILGILSYPTPKPHLKSIWGASLKLGETMGSTLTQPRKFWRVGRIWHWDTKSCHLMNVLKSTGQGMFVSYQQDVAIEGREIWPETVLDLVWEGCLGEGRNPSRNNIMEAWNRNC